MNPNKQIIPRAMMMNEQTIRFDFGAETSRENYHTIQQFCQAVENDRNHLLEEVVPSNKTVTVFYRKKLVNPSGIIQELLTKWENRTDSIVSVNTRVIEIPVCYDALFSEDIPRICDHTGLTREEVIAIHTGTLYKVYLIGFLPGFPYLGELPKVLHVPRLKKPRLSVPKGTVGIGGTQTGIYPIESPGGWNIIGRTPLDLYYLERVEPFLIRAGDQLKFRSISLETFNKIKEDLASEPEMIRQFVKEGL